MLWSHKALWANAPLPYPHLITPFLQNFNVPLDDQPFVKVKRFFSIGVGAVTSFGYWKDMDGQWVRKQDLPPPILDECTLSLPPQQDASSSLLTEVLKELRDLRAFLVSALMRWILVSLGLKTIWVSSGIALIHRHFLSCFSHVLHH